MRWLLTALLSTWLFALPAWSQCTDGVDCLCDTLTDPSIIDCEDYDNPAYYQDVPGAWYETGGGGNDSRGTGSAWYQRYGLTDQGQYRPGEPPSPTLGESCGVSGPICGPMAWHPDDLWDANQYSPFYFIVEDGDWNSDPAMTTNAPIKPGGATGTYGNYSLAHRVPDDRQGTGISDGVNFGSRTEFGVTMLMAWPDNIVGSGVFNAPWKGEEYGPSDDAWFFGSGRFSLNNRFPFFDPFAFYDAGQTEADCNAAIAGATIEAGSLVCTEAALYLRTLTSNYVQATDWPFGEWGCMQGYVSGLGTSNTTWRIWFNEELISGATGWDSSFLRANSVSTYKPNAYSNYTESNNLNYPAYRFQDNVVHTSGPPLSCAAVGFTGTTPTPGVSLSVLPTTILEGQSATWTGLENGVGATSASTCDFDVDGSAGYEITGVTVSGGLCATSALTYNTDGQINGTVRFNGGDYDGLTANATLTVNNPPSPQVTLAIADNPIAEGGSTTFTGTLANGTPITPTCDFDFDGGATNQTGVAVDSGVCTSDPATFATAGDYDITVTVNDTGGDYDGVSDGPDTLSVNAVGSGLILDAPFEEGSGSTTANLVGASCSLVGGVGWSSDVQAGTGSTQSLDFTGGYLNCTNLNVTGTGITVAAWVKPDSFPVSYPRIVSKANDNSASIWGLFVNASDATAYTNADVTTSANNYFDTVDNDLSVVPGVWQHLAFTANTLTGDLRVFKDGVFYGNTSMAAGLISTATLDVIIGDSFVGGGRAWDGHIDDVKVYDEALTDGQVALLADIGGGGGSSSISVNDLTPELDEDITVSVQTSGCTAPTSCTIDVDGTQYLNDPDCSIVHDFDTSGNSRLITAVLTGGDCPNPANVSVDVAAPVLTLATPVPASPSTSQTFTLDVASLTGCTESASCGATCDGGAAFDDVTGTPPLVCPAQGAGTFDVGIQCPCESETAEDTTSITVTTAESSSVDITPNPAQLDQNVNVDITCSGSAPTTCSTVVNGQFIGTACSYSNLNLVQAIDYVFVSTLTGGDCDGQTPQETVSVLTPTMTPPVAVPNRLTSPATYQLFAGTLTGCSNPTLFTGTGACAGISSAQDGLICPSADLPLGSNITGLSVQCEAELVQNSTSVTIDPPVQKPAASGVRIEGGGLR